MKTRTPLLGTKVFTTKSTLNKPAIGTMRADEEASKKAKSGLKKLSRSSTNFKPRENPLKNTGLVKKLPTTRKLGNYQGMQLVFCDLERMFDAILYKLFFSF